MSSPGVDAGRAERAERAAARLKARYRSEARFRLAGIAAVAIAGAALATLVISLLVQGVSALTAYKVTLDVEIPASVDPDGTGDPDVIRRANFASLLQNALRTEFPAVTSRSELRELFGVVSSVNASTLLNRVIDNPSLVGQMVSFSMPISDDLDLYFKGAATPQERRVGAGAAEVSIDGDLVEIVAQGRAFAFALDQIKARLAAEAERAGADAERLAAVAANETDPARARASQAQAEAARARAEDLRARTQAPDAAEELGATQPSVLVEINGGVVRASEIAPGRIVGEALAPLDGSAVAQAGAWSTVVLATPRSERRVTDQQIVWAEELQARGRVERVFNGWLFTRGDSREPELAGMRTALLGSILTMLVTMLLAVPIGVATAVYLEEFAPKNRWTDFIEVNINNLAAVPSIVFGLLGLAVFINIVGLPRSAPLVGGMVLALMTLPTVIISTRASLKAVPPSIRVGALGIGASQVQTVFHHVLPLAAPGIMTGSIIGLAQALGETAPLLMIGMVAFVADPPTGLTSPATVMPVQIFLWSDSAERAFEARTAALILSLLSLMVVLNGLAVILRRRFERRW
ncbi:MAG: phosphate ABC transporter permease PstA [Maricaulaceae bacterium]|jgi:phosphate transport system permease protein